MKYDIINWVSGEIIFSAEINCDETAPKSLKLRYAVLAAIEASADLSGADLYGANLSGADLYGADLYGADLYGANLYRANLSEANLYRANLSEANLSGANLYRANLSEADLYGANLSEANLSGANLSGANLSGANLYRANLSGADLYGANLSGANLSGANLSGASLSGVEHAPNVYSFGPVGKTNRTGFAYQDSGICYIRLGCFVGTEEETVTAVSKKYGENSAYVQAVKAACAVIKERMKG